MQMATQIISVPSAFNCNPSPFMLWKNGIKLAKCSINFTPKIQKIQWKIALPGQFTWPIPLSPTFHGGLWKWWDRHKENAKPSSLNPTATSAARRSNKKDSHRSGYILDNQTKDKQNPGLCVLFLEPCLSNWSRVYAGMWLHPIQRFRFYSNMLSTAHLGAVWAPNQDGNLRWAG